MAWPFIGKDNGNLCAFKRGHAFGKYGPIGKGKLDELFGRIVISYGQSGPKGMRKMRLKISEKVLRKIGFKFEDLADESPYEQWIYKGIIIWCFNEEYWIIDMLDQAGVESRFIYLDELEMFFVGAKLIKKGAFIKIFAGRTAHNTRMPK